MVSKVVTYVFASRQAQAGSMVGDINGVSYNCTRSAHGPHTPTNNGTRAPTTTRRDAAEKLAPNRPLWAHIDPYVTACQACGNSANGRN